MTFRAEPYDCFSAIAEVGTSSFRIDSESREAASVYARSRVTLVFIDPETGRPAPPLRAYRDALVEAVG